MKLTFIIAGEEIIVCISEEIELKFALARAIRQKYPEIQEKVYLSHCNDFRLDPTRAINNQREWSWWYVPMRFRKRNVITEDTIIFINRFDGCDDTRDERGTFII